MNKKLRTLLLTFLFLITIIFTGHVLADISKSNNEGKIIVNKSATKDIGVDGNEIYGRKSNVTLSVLGNSYTSTSTLDVVLVIDRSGSMNDKAKYTDTKTKMVATKESAVSVATKLLSNNTNGRTLVKMGIVTFGSNVIDSIGTEYNAKTLTSNTLNSNLTTITGIINNIPNSVGERGDTLGAQGTNIQSGLERARTLLSGSTANNKVVILLTDGKPTYFNYDGTRYGDGNHDGKGYWEEPYCVLEDEYGRCIKELKPSTAAIEEATLVKENATIYTVGFGLGDDNTTKTFLSNVATGTDKAYLADDEAELLKNFDNIVNSITTIATNVVVTDIVPVGFVVDEDSLKNTYKDAVSITYNEDGTTTITWNIGVLSVTDNPTLTYQVEAKEDYYGAMYTNSNAILTGNATKGNPAYPNGVIEEEFPMPVVAIPMVTKDNNYTAKLGTTLVIDKSNSILNNDSNIKLTDGEGSLVRNEIIIKSASCGSVDDIKVNNDGTFTYTPNSSCYLENEEVTFEYEVKSYVTIDNEEHIVISNTSNIVIDLTKDDSKLEEPNVDKISVDGDTTHYIDEGFTYSIKYNTIINNHIGSSVITITDKLPYELDLTKENNLDGGIYDKNNKTITWNITIDNIDSYKNQNNSINIEKTIKVFYKNIENNVEQIVNNVEVTTDIDNKLVSDEVTIKVERSKVLVEYIDNLGNKLLDDVTLEGLVKNTYETNALNTINVDGIEYVLVSTRIDNKEITLTNNYKGEFKEEDTLITYVYYINRGFIDDSQTALKKDGTDKVVTSDSVFDYSISYNSKINNYIGDAIVTLVDKLPYEIDESKEYNLDGGIYDKNNKTITWVINIDNIDTYKNGEYSVNIEKNISLAFKDLDASMRVLVNEVSAKLETSKSSNELESEKETELYIKGNVITHFVDTLGNKISNDETTTGLVGNDYVTNYKVIDGYKLVDVKGVTEGKYIDGTIEVTYIYYKQEANIVDNTIYKDGTTLIENTSDEFNYNIEYDAVIKNYIGDIEVIITDTLDYEIDESKTYDLDGGVYDKNTKTITWIEVIEDIDTNKDGNYLVNIDKKIKLTYLGIAPTVREVTNKVVGLIKTSINEDTTKEVEFDTTVKVSGNVISHYVDIEGNALNADIKQTGLVGEDYLTSALDIDGYRLVEVQGETNGKYIDGNIEVTYIYYKQDGSIEENYIIKTGTEEITKVDEKFNYRIEYNTIIKGYIGDAVVTIKDKLPYEIDESKEYDLDGGIYDKTTKTITWNVEITNIDTNTNGDYEVEIIKNISFSYKGITPETRKVTNEVVGTIKTSVKEEETEPAYKDTLVKVSGKVIAHFIDTDNNTLLNDDVLTGLVGEEYVTSSKNIDNYELVDVKGDKTGYYIDGVKEVTYIYYKKTGEVLGDEITKTGTEEINKIDEKVDYKITYEGILKNYIGNAVITITDSLPYEIDETKDYNLDGGIYNKEAKTITWVEEISNINTNANGDYSYRLEKNITLSYLGIDPYTRIITNIAVGNVKTDITDKTTEPSNHNTKLLVYGKVIASYIDTNNNKLREDIISNDLVGNEYVTEKLDFTNYELVEIKGNTNGNYIDDTIEVVYVYYKKTGDITNNEVIKTGSEEITSSDERVEYSINYKATINNYIGNAVITIIDTLPYNIDLSLSDLDGGIYNENDNTISWNINILDINTYINGEYKIDITKNLVLSYKDIDLTNIDFTNKVDVNIKTDVSEENSKDEFTTEVNVMGKVIVNYVDDKGNILLESIIMTDKVGTNYETLPKEIKDYLLLKVEGIEKGTYTEEDIIVNYIYTEIGKGGDIEVLPPQTGDSIGYYFISLIVSFIMIVIIGLKKLF